MDMKGGKKILSLFWGKGHWFISFTKVGEKEPESDSERREKERMRYIVFFWLLFILYKTVRVLIYQVIIVLVLNENCFPVKKNLLLNNK